MKVSTARNPGIFQITSMTVGEDHLLLESDLDDSDYDDVEDYEDNVNFCDNKYEES